MTSHKQLKYKYLCPKMYLCTKRASKIIVPPKEMLLSFSIGTFLTSSDVTYKKLQLHCTKINKMREKYSNAHVWKSKKVDSEFTRKRSSQCRWKSSQVVEKLPTYECTFKTLEMRQLTLQKRLSRERKIFKNVKNKNK